MFIFADDTKVLSSVSSESEAEHLQQTIDQLNDWAARWQMEFNVDKCSVVHLGKNNPRHKYSLSGKPLKESESEKDVGVFIQENGKFNEQCREVAKKYNQIIGQVRRSFSNKSATTMLNIYNTYILPHITYGASVWQPHLKKDIAILESIQRRFTRMIDGMATLSYEERLEALGLPTLHTRGRKNDLIQAYRIMNDIDKVEGLQFNKVSDYYSRDTRSSAKSNLVV